MTNADQNAAARERVHTVLLYSPKAERRAVVRTAIGRRPAADVGRIEWIECETNDELLEHVDRGGIDLAILDGEAQPTGGMGLSRQLKYELDDCPAVLVLIAREVDRWLATWALADAVLLYPVDPLTAGQVVAEQLRNRTAGIPVLR